MGSEWIDRDVQGRRRLCLVVDDQDWRSISSAAAKFWKRLFAEVKDTDWSALYITIQPDYGFNFYFHAEAASEKPTDKPIYGPRFELEFTRMGQDFLENPDSEHPALQEAAWVALEEALGDPDVVTQYNTLCDGGRSIRGGEWDAKDGYPREIKPRNA